MILKISEIKSYVEQITKIDGGSSLFRYPADKDLNIHMRKGKKWDFKQVGNFLDGVIRI